MKQFLLFDQGVIKDDASFSPFALTDVLSGFASEFDQPLIHFWQLPKTFILGMKDTRLPKLNAALQQIRQADYQPILRNAGGLGVISDRGVLNVSLILPNTQQLSIDGAYEKMVTWFQTTWADRVTISAKEISDSYCPGKFDLSIEGKKIAGIAQRRVKDGIAIMLYLSVNGDQAARGNLVRDFYQAGLTTPEKFDYPLVNPNSMTTLSQSLNQTLSIGDTKKQLLANLPVLDQSAKLEYFFNTPEYTQRIESMRTRNLIIQEEFHAQL